jgi:ribosome maturation factor RimP
MIDNQAEIKGKIKEIASRLGAELIDFRIFNTSGRNTLRCVIDYPLGGITIDNCAAINKKVVIFLESSKLLGDDYTVEINSPGLDRPLKTNKDFLRVQGKNVSLWLVEPVEDKDYLEGEVIKVSDEELEIVYKDKKVKINLDKIKIGKEKIAI